jgi:predicted DNA repair protein MutK
MIGGAFLCYEGFEKLAHRLLHRGNGEKAHREELGQALANPSVDLMALEKEKIKGAVRTDFILSAEIIVIALGTVAAAPLPQRIGVLVGIALIMTVGVYGLVAGIVKLDDAGLHLHRSTGDGAIAGARRAIGGAILAAAPWLMKALSVAGTAAMFLVGGGILVHGLPPLAGVVEALARNAGAAGLAASLLADALVGIAAGGMLLAAMTAVHKLLRRR